MSREMKDSEIEWVGEIPKEWYTIKVKYIFNIIGGNGFPDMLQGNTSGDYPFCKVSDINSKEIYVDKASNYVTKDIVKNNKFNIIPINSILIAKIGEALKKNHRKINTVGCIIDNNLQAFTTNENNKYCYYLLNAIDMLWFDNGGTVPSINNFRLKNFKVPKVTISEQQRIADYLDKKVSLIDSIITQTTITIEEYKKYKQSLITQTVTKGLNPDVEMKDSGIDYIGAIPKAWEMTKLRRYSYIRYGLGEPPKLSAEGLPIIRATNIERGKIVKNDLIRARLEDIPYSKDVVLKEGDILIVRSGAYAGDIAYITQEWEGALAGYDMIISITKLNSKFVSYALLSEYVLKAQLYLSRMRSAQPHLNAEEVGRTVLVIPSIQEQKKIAEYLDKKCMDIEKLIIQKKQFLEEIKLYKKSLIYECVTGKREVD